jgi:hypothetical protein
MHRKRWSPLAGLCTLRMLLVCPRQTSPTLSGTHCLHVLHQYFLSRVGVGVPKDCIQLSTMCVINSLILPGTNKLHKEAGCQLSASFRQANCTPCVRTCTFFYQGLFCHGALQKQRASAMATDICVDKHVESFHRCATTNITQLWLYQQPKREHGGLEQHTSTADTRHMRRCTVWVVWRGRKRCGAYCRCWSRSVSQQPLLHCQSAVTLRAHLCELLNAHL